MSDIPADLDTTAVGLLSAILAVQQEAPKLKKSATNPHFKSKFAPLDEIVETIGPILHRHGLVWRTKPSYSDVGPTLKYEMSHAPSGQSDEGEMPLLLSKNDAQGQGSAITYARRYALCAYLNLVADDDDDGARAAAGRSRQAQGPALASDAQKKRLRGDITRNGLNLVVVDALFAGVGFSREGSEKVNDAINRLTSAQASALIDTIGQGAVKTGETDVPADASGFVHPSPDTTDMGDAFPIEELHPPVGADDETPQTLDVGPS